MRRGFWAGAAFITLLRCHGGDWFDKMEPGGWKVQLDTDEGHKAMDVLMRLVPYMEPTALNASDDEANTEFYLGRRHYADVFPRSASVWRDLTEESVVTPTVFTGRYFPSQKPVR